MVNLPDMFIKAFGSVWNAIKSNTTSAVNAVKTSVTTGWNAIKSTTTSAWNAIKSGLTSAWKQLLRFTDMTVDEIGVAVGMGDANYFSRMFRKVEGSSPSEYRKQW